MESQNARAEFFPSLMWVLPIACSVWIGIFVDGWFANPSESNRYHEVLEPVLEGLLTPGIALLFVWLLWSPASAVSRLQVASFVLISSLPIAYLSHQRPGQSWSSVSKVLAYYVDRPYFIGANSQSILELGTVFAVAAWSLVALNRYLSQIVFHRVPIRRNPEGTSFVHRSKDAFRALIFSPEEEIVNRRFINRCLVAGALGLVGLGLVFLVTGNADRFLKSAFQGMLTCGLIYFWLWPASECRSPLWALLALLPGVVAFSSVPHFLRLSRSFALHIWTPSEQALIAATIGTPLVLLWASLVLLASTNQMPRRTQGLPAVECGSKRPVPTGKPPSLRMWMVGFGLWVLACLGAAWIPTNVDSETLTDNDRLSIRDGWLAAQLLQKLAGNRDYIRFRYNITANQSWIALRVPKYSEDWDSCIKLLEQRAREGDVCQLVFDEPVSDQEFRKHLLRQGINLYGNPNSEMLSTGLPILDYNPFHPDIGY